VLAIALVMAAYAGFLLSLTLHLQGPLGFSPLRAGLTFAVYAAGFGGASLAWTRLAPSLRRHLPALGPLAMAVALLAIGATAGGGWRPGLVAPLLLVAGAGHAFGFSPLASRLAGAVSREQAADLSGLILTASLVGGVLGTAGLAGIYLGTAAQGPARALLLTTAAIAASLLVTSGLAVLTGPRPLARRPGYTPFQPKT